jgi:hypothetical protein
MLWGKPIDWDEWAISLVIGVSICQTGYWWFQKSRRGFAMFSEDIVIDVRNLSRRYEIYNTPRDRLKQLFLTYAGLFRKISWLFCEIIFYPYFEISGKLQKECA